MTTIELSTITLPDGSDVLGIGKKAMLGQGRLRSITVPEEARFIDDWAFAGCTALEEVRMPRCRLGRGVFKDCRALKHIYVASIQILCYYIYQIYKYAESQKYTEAFYYEN